MSALFQVIGRELRVRALVPATGAATAVAILVAGWLVSGGSRFKEVAETSIYFAGFFLVTGALLLGSVMLARDLEGSRSLLWLARPIGAWTAYAGKLIAAFLLVLATTLLVAVPTFIVDPGLLHEPGVFAGAAGFAVGCIALGAALGLLLRNRSAWFIPAMAILIGFGAGVWINAEPFLLGRSTGIVDSLISLGVAALVVAIIAAHGIAFARGRHDARRQARIFTLILGAVLGVVLVISWSFGAWLRQLDLGDFGAFWLRGSSGDAVVIDGYRTRMSAANWSRTFVLDAGTGRTVPLAPGAWDVAISPRRIFYAAPTAIGRRRFEIRAVDLGPVPSTRKTGILLAQQINRLATPADGSRVAVSSWEGTAVFDLAGKSLGSFKAEFSGRGGTGQIFPVFADRDRLRLFESSGGSVVIREADLRTRTIRTLGTISGSIVVLTSDLERVIVKTDPPSRSRRAVPKLALHDARTGAKIFDLPAGSHSAHPLADGTWAVFMGKEERSFRRVGSAGEILSEIRLDVRPTGTIGEVRPGILTVMGPRDDPSAPWYERSVMLVDVATGRIVKKIPGVTYWPRRDHAFASPGSAEARLIVRNGELHLIDPGTLEAKRIALR